MIHLHQMRLILRLSHIISVEIDNLMAQSMQVDIKIPGNLITHGYILYLKRECTVSCVRNLIPRISKTEPCIPIRKDVLSRHESSAMHKEGLEQERAHRAVKARGGIAEAMQKQLLLSREAVIGAMKCLYWLCKQEIYSILPECVHYLH